MFKTPTNQLRTNISHKIFMNFPLHPHSISLAYEWQTWEHFTSPNVGRQDGWHIQTAELVEIMTPWDNLDI